LAFSLDTHDSVYGGDLGKDIMLSGSLTTTDKLASLAKKDLGGGWTTKTITGIILYVI